MIPPNHRNPQTGRLASRTRTSRILPACTCSSIRSSVLEQSRRIVQKPSLSRRLGPKVFPPGSLRHSDFTAFNKVGLTCTRMAWMWEQEASYAGCEGVPTDAKLCGCWSSLQDLLGSCLWFFGLVWPACDTPPAQKAEPTGSTMALQLPVTRSDVDVRGSTNLPSVTVDVDHGMEPTSFLDNDSAGTSSSAGRQSMQAVVPSSPISCGSFFCFRSLPGAVFALIAGPFGLSGAFQGARGRLRFAS